MGAKGKRHTEKFINQQSGKLVQKAILVAEKLRNEEVYEGMKINLNQILTEAGMNVKIHFYGSRTIGLGHDESDLDIYIEYGNNFHMDKNVERDREVLKKIIEAIENAGLWKIQAKILTASVPILQVLYIPSNMKCDFSVSNGLGVVNSLMMGYLFDLQPEAKSFYHFMKIFLQRYNRYFEGYLLKLLVIFFLQNQKILPSIKMVQENLPVKAISGWPTQYEPSRKLSYYGLEQMNSYKSYIPKFFDFYFMFKYEKNVMSIYDGKAIERLLYKYREEVDEYELCIFGPINRKHNIGKYPSEKDVRYFFRLCDSLSHEFKKKYVFSS